MKKSLLLLLAIPLFAGAFYLRSLASWRPQKVFVAKSWESHQLLFSRDGKTLVAMQEDKAHFYSGIAWDRIVALDVENNFSPRWNSKPYPSSRDKAQLFGNDDTIWIGRHADRFFDVRTGKTGRHTTSVRETVFSPDGKWLLMRDYRDSGHTSIHPAPQPTSGSRIPGAVIVLDKPNRSTEAFAFSPDSKTLAVGVGDQSGAHIEFYDTTSWKRTAFWKDVNHKSQKNSGYFYKTLQWSPNGQLLFSAWRHPRAFKSGTSIWRTANGQKLTERQGAYDQDLSPVQIDDQGRAVWVTPHDVTLTSLAGKAKSLFRPAKGEISAAAISPDGSYLIVALGSGELWQRRLK